MRNAGVGDRVQRVLEQHSGNVRMLDAYWQWATNPTPPAAGYALEENCGFIATNLLLRYGEPAIELVTQLAAECRELRQEASVYDLQQAVIAVLNGPVGNELREEILHRLNQPTPERQVLAAWLVSRARWSGRQGPEAWLAGEFDWALGVDLQAAHKDLQAQLVRTIYDLDGSQVDLAREALLVGVVNRLLYRNVAGRMEPKMRPGPRLPLARVAY